MLSRQSSLLGFFLFVLAAESWLPKKPAKLPPKFEIESGCGGMVPSQNVVADAEYNNRLRVLLGVASLTTAAVLLNHDLQPDQAIDHRFMQLKDQFVVMGSAIDPHLMTKTFDETPSIGANEKSSLIQYMDVLKDAMVIPDFDSRIALEVSESVVASIIGGVSSAVIFRQQFSSTDGFKGILSILRRVTGTPPAVAIIAATFFGAALSVFSRFLQKEICRAQAKGRMCCRDLAAQTEIVVEDAKNKLAFQDIAADIGQWLVYNSLCQQFTLHYGEFDSRVVHFSFGALAGMVAYGIRAQKNTEFSVAKALPGVPPTTSTPADVMKAAVESGLLFLSFEEILQFLHGVVPEELNKKFIFETVVEEIEEELLDRV